VTQVRQERKDNLRQEFRDQWDQREDLAHRDWQVLMGFKGRPVLTEHRVRKVFKVMQVLLAQLAMLDLKVSKVTKVLKDFRVTQVLKEKQVLRVLWERKVRDQSGRRDRREFKAFRVQLDLLAILVVQVLRDYKVTRAYRVSKVHREVPEWPGKTVRQVHREQRETLVHKDSKAKLARLEQTARYKGLKET
jgi:hypothetical protein